MRSPVILNVNPDPDALDWEEEFLGRMDIPVNRCCGPDAEGGCPLLRGEHCDKIETADGVLFQLDLDRTDHRQILAKYALLLDVPIRVVVNGEQKEKWAALLSHVEVFVPPVGPATLDAFAAEVESETGLP